MVSWGVVHSCFHGELPSYSRAPSLMFGHFHFVFFFEFSYFIFVLSARRHSRGTHTVSWYFFRDLFGSIIESMKIGIN